MPDIFLSLDKQDEQYTFVLTVDEEEFELPVSDADLVELYRRLLPAKAVRKYMNSLLSTEEL